LLIKKLAFSRYLIGDRRLLPGQVAANTLPQRRGISRFRIDTIDPNRTQTTVAAIRRHGNFGRKPIACA
jgi:hypothetical protein